MDIYERSLEKHYEWAGKLETRLRAPIESLDDLALCYTPGVSRACTVIAAAPASCIFSANLTAFI